MKSPADQRFSPSRWPGNRNGFSLLELLAVISIISLLAVTVMPSVTSILGATKAGAAGDELSGQLSAAASRARARNQEVWVGLKQVPEGVQIVSYDGQPFGRPALRRIRLDRASLVGISQLSGRFPNGLPVGQDILDVQLPLDAGTAPTAQEDADYWIIFNPRGEMKVRQDGQYVRRLQIGLGSLQGAGGTSPSIVLVNGLTARSEVLRP